MEALVKRLRDSVARRAVQGKARILGPPANTGVDFCSNDYLGLARSAQLAENVRIAYSRIIGHLSESTPMLGSTGSRLLTGNSPVHERLETFLAQSHEYECALLGNSGYDLNIGILGSVPGPDAVVICDEFLHNSLLMGTRLGRQSQTLVFKHNDMDSLESILQSDHQRHEGNQQRERLVVVESVYSMDGDQCPLRVTLDLCERYGAVLVVDEAHSAGVYGSKGRGLLFHYGLHQHEHLLCAVHTFGKAIGCHGACVLSQHTELKSFLINYCRPLIYSTSLPLHSVVSVQEAYDFLSEEGLKLSERLIFLVNYFRSTIERSLLVMPKCIQLLPSTTAIQSVLVPGNHNVCAAAAALHVEGLEVLPIRAPTVPSGKERLRIIVHAHNTEEQVMLSGAPAGYDSGLYLLADASILRLPLTLLSVSFTIQELEGDIPMLFTKHPKILGACDELADP